MAAILYLREQKAFQCHYERLVWQLCDEESCRALPLVCGTLIHRVCGCESARSTVSFKFCFAPEDFRLSDRSSWNKQVKKQSCDTVPLCCAVMKPPFWKLAKPTKVTLTVVEATEPLSLLLFTSHASRLSWPFKFSVLSVSCVVTSVHEGKRWLGAPHPLWCVRRVY